MDVSETAHEAEDDVEFHLQLNCTSRKTIENRTFTLDKFPSSVLEVKKAIEAKLSIPVCVQSLSYQLAPLSDSDSLAERRIRSGDTLTVSYLAEGECELIREIVEWIRQVDAAISCPGVDVVSESLIISGINSGYIEVLPIQIFDWLNPKAYVSKLYFKSVGGLEALINLYRSLSNRNWSTMKPLHKYLESFSIQSIGNFGENFPLRRMSLEEGVLDLVMVSFLRKKLKMGERIEGFGETGDSVYEGEIWRALLTDAVYIIANYSELPECQIQIASRPDVLDQVLCVSISEQLPCSTSVVVAEIFVCLSHSSATHPYLTKQEIVGGLLKVTQMRDKCNKGQLSDDDRQTLIALKCFTLVVCAQLALASPQLFPPQFIETVTTDMNKFLTETNPEVIRAYEEEKECVWATLLPYVKLFYVPQNLRKDIVSSCEQLRELTQASEKIILFFLHSKMSREYAHDILVKEGLMDYVTVLPWHVSKESRTLAESVVSELHSHVKLQPPKLCSIVQAKLARLHFGLERVVSCHSPVDLIRSLCQNSPN